MRTGIGPDAGVMLPWYMEKNIGIQKYKYDPSLSAEGVREDREGGRRRRAARQIRPTCLRRASGTTRTRGVSRTPDFVVRSKDIVVKASSA
ncbi:MAG: hypothetical protein QM736_17770 [Vicinamibacterales bacterium]